jgi:hypothetical protein
MAKSGLDIVALLQTLSVPEYYLGIVIYLYPRNSSPAPYRVPVSKTKKYREQNICLLIGTGTG